VKVEIYTLSQKMTNVAHHNFDTDQPILIIFWHRCCWGSNECAIKRQFVIPPFLTNVSGETLNMVPCLMGKHGSMFHGETWFMFPGETWSPRNCLFSHAVYRVSKM